MWHESRILANEIREDRSESTSNPITNHRGPGTSRNREREPPVLIVDVIEVCHRKRASVDPDTVGTQRLEGATFPDPTDQADSFARPLRRRLRKTARPPRLDIRARKPWFLDRRRTLG